MRASATHASVPARQASKILMAWASGNEPLLQKELWKSHQPLGGPLTGVEEERMELLQAASVGMLAASRPLRSESRDSQVRCCLDLLRHLAQTPFAPETADLV